MVDKLLNAGPLEFLVSIMNGYKFTPTDVNMFSIRNKVGVSLITCKYCQRISDGKILVGSWDTYTLYKHLSPGGGGQVIFLIFLSIFSTL